MRINHNISTLRGLSFLSSNAGDMSRSIERLSTGIRINRASDDAAGLGVSEKLRAQVRGCNQAFKNAQDAAALLSIADGAMQEITSVLQRTRELAVQAANDTLTSTERSYLDTEYQSLLKEIDRINDVTNYNGIKVLSGGVNSANATALEDSLQQRWLGGAMDRVNAAYGLTVNGPLTINVESIDGLSGTGGYGGGSGTPLGGTGTMTLDADDFEAAVESGDTDGTMPQYGGILNAEQLVTHEMTHVMQYMNGLSTPTWFAEGAAESSYGADERVAAILAANPGWDENNIIANASFVSGGTLTSDGTFNNSNIDYAAAYLSVMHLNEQNGGSAISSVYADMMGGADFSTALSNALGGAAGVSTWNSTVTGGGLNAAAFGNYSTTGDILGLGDDIGASDISAAAPYGFASVSVEVGENLMMHVGANGEVQSDELEIALASCSSSALGIGNTALDNQGGAVAAIGVLDDAIDQINRNRTGAGTYIYRMEHTMTNLRTAEVNQQDAESRIRDTDFARETASLSRAQILSQSATAMLSQSNMLPQAVLQLLG
jgi:flagellin